MSGVAKHDALKERLRRLPRPLLVGLDVDGTLAPIVADPAAARIPEATQQLLR
ncbi:MAG: trehalose-phosphatase, partial [Myxococcales bacterium]|nr:trehalose-phosphatase [Myxococcales bacterium]